MIYNRLDSSSLLLYNRAMQFVEHTPMVYLTRHATPDWDLPGIIYHRPPGPSLVPKGDEEARELAEFLKKNGVQKIYTSPLERCLQTAHAAVAETGSTLMVADGLIEVQPGESSRSILDRSWQIFESGWRESWFTGPVALVTHGGVVNVLLRRLGMSDYELHRMSRFDHSNQIPPAGAWQVTGSLENNQFELRLVFVPGRTGEIMAAD